MQQDNSGLFLFFSVTMLNASGLLLDFILWQCHLKTVSQLVWEFPKVGMMIMLVQLLGTAGLACHFFRRD